MLFPCVYVCGKVPITSYTTYTLLTNVRSRSQILALAVKRYLHSPLPTKTLTPQPHKKLTSSAENRHARTHISIQISQLSSTHQPLTQLLRKKKKEQTPTRKTMVPLSNPSPSPLPNNSRRPAQPSPAQRNARSDRNRNQECNERVEREIGRKGDG